MSKRLAILLSGRGSNFEAIRRSVAEGTIDASIAAVITNRPGAPGIERARAHGLPSFEIDHRSYPDRESHEAAVDEVLLRSEADLIVLAGYMRLLSSAFVDRWRNRIVNIHPSLLPSFPGTDAQRQAWEYGVRVTGCTVHFVDETLDGGPIILQRIVSVADDDTVETLTERILAIEHESYVEALRLLCSGSVVIDGRRVTIVRSSSA